MWRRNFSSAIQKQTDNNRLQTRTHVTPKTAGIFFLHQKAWWTEKEMVLETETQFL